MVGKRPSRVWRVFIVLVVVVILIAVLFGVQYRPLMLDSACKLAKNTALQVINQTVCDVLEKEEIQYDDLIIIETDQSGAITSLQANSTKINRIKSQTALLVQNALSDINHQVIGVPLGTLCGFTVFSAMGPSISCRYLLSNIPTVGLEYHFDGAGINQTLHSILMSVTVPLSVTLPLQSIDIEVKSTFIVGETILVGEVPDTYTNVISDPEVADDLFNYGDIG